MGVRIGYHTGLMVYLPRLEVDTAKYCEGFVTFIFFLHVRDATYLIILTRYSGFRKASRSRSERYLLMTYGPESRVMSAFTLVNLMICSLKISYDHCVLLSLGPLDAMDY